MVDRCYVYGWYAILWVGILVVVYSTRRADGERQFALMAWAVGYTICFLLFSKWFWWYRKNRRNAGREPESFRDSDG